MTADQYIWTQQDFERRYVQEDWLSYRPLLSHCVRHGLPGRILDIGAGLGYFMECCQAWGLPCSGVDGSSHAVARCRAKGLDIERVELTSSTKLPFGDATFSIVVLNQVLNQLRPPVARSVFAEAGRVLTSNGILIATSISRFYPQAESDRTNLYFYTPSELRRELEAAGFHFVADLNEPRRLLGEHPVGLGIMRLAYRAFRWDTLSESASFVMRR